MATINGTNSDDKEETELLGTDQADLIRGFGGSDNLFGLGGDDRLEGGPGRDFLRGYSGNDQLFGGPDNDQLMGNDGDDLINGGEGSDEVIYFLAPAAVDVDLANERGLDGAGGTDRLVSIEYVMGSVFDDILRGDGETNFFNGRGGDDTFHGRGGLDMAVYRSASAGVSVDLRTGRAEDGDGGIDTFTSIELALGSNFDDVLRGDDKDNDLYGLSGSDVLRGFGGDDFFGPGTGNDVIDGGDGMDTVSYLIHPANRGIRGFLDLGIVIVANDRDKLKSIENLRGTEYKDKLVGDDGKNSLFGYGGTDTIKGGEGNDAIWGGGGDDLIQAGDGDDDIALSFGADQINGGDGRDKLTIAEAINGIEDDTLTAKVNLKTGEASFGTGNGVSKLANIENVSGSYKDDGETFTAAIRMMLTGSDGANRLLGGTSDDVLNGAKGDDKLDGDDGNDILNGGQGRDTLTGGAGKDVFVFTGNWGRDTITDFDLKGEKIQISGEVTRFKEFKDAARQKGDHVIYDAGRDGENVIVIQNTELDAMKPNDLAFV